MTEPIQSLDDPRCFLTRADFHAAAAELECDVFSIQAVADVEASGAAFRVINGSVRPRLKYEGHQFWRHAPGWRKMAAYLPNIVYAGWTERFTVSEANEWNRFSTAFKLDPDAAMKSCSWGLFQIMGFNHQACGFATVGEFVDAMKSGARAHLLAFTKLIKANYSWHQAVRLKDWSTFARGYNGPGYRDHTPPYDVRMGRRYAQLTGTTSTA